MIVFAAAAVLILLLIIPIRIFADYHGRLRLWVRALLFRCDIYPPDKSEKAKKPKKSRQAKPKAEAEESAKKESFPEKAARVLSLIEEMLGPLRRAVRRLVRVESIALQVTVGSEDAANTAVYTGMLWGVVCNLVSLLDRIAAVEKQELNVLPSYNEPVLKAEGSCILRTTLANIIGAAAIMGIAFVRYKIKNKKQEE